MLLPIRMHMSTSNSKHGGFLNKQKMKIPTQKGKHSCKFTELSLKRKEGMMAFCISVALNGNS